MNFFGWFKFQQAIVHKTKENTLKEYALYLFIRKINKNRLWGKNRVENRKFCSRTLLSFGCFCSDRAFTVSLSGQIENWQIGKAISISIENRILSILVNFLAFFGVSKLINHFLENFISWDFFLHMCVVRTWLKWLSL